MKHTTSIRAGNWFGCGRVITEESWDGFLAARRAYWQNRDTVQGKGETMMYSFRETKMTRQQRSVTNALDGLPHESGSISVDVFDPQGEVKHVCICRKRGRYYARKGTPDPRNLFARLPRDLRVTALRLAVVPA